MKIKTNQKQDFFTALVLFVATVFMAWYYRWQTADLAWGLWISSLTLGYSFIIVSIIGSLFHDPYETQNRGKRNPALMKAMTSPLQKASQGMVLGLFILLMFGLNKATLPLFAVALVCTGIGAIPVILEKRGVSLHSNVLLTGIRMIAGIPSALFMLAFFSIHFLGFHLVHGMFLNAFFPRVNPSDLFNSIENGFRLYKTVLTGVLAQFWLFILVSAMSQAPEYVRAFRDQGRSMMMRPYANVVRMHLMIILFGFMSVLKLEGAMLYLLLVLYFFPMGSLLRNWNKKSKFRFQTRSGIDR